MNVALPYTECYVKRSFLMGPKAFNWGKDEMIPAVLLSSKQYRAKLPYLKSIYLNIRLVMIKYYNVQSLIGRLLVRKE